MTPTPRTDAERYDCTYRGDMGCTFTADRGKHDPDGDHVSADFACQLERDIHELNERLKDAHSAVSAFLGFHSDRLTNAQAKALFETLLKLKPN